MDFKELYKSLNDKQREATDAIEGPLLVIAGPGTGKTQLLSARVAQILQKTDTLPQSILCLTFTESGANNMRERLTRFIGKDAYDVTISTYHAFGGDLIRRFPEYFSETRMQNPVDNLGQHQIVAQIVDKMSFLNPLKQTQHHLGDLISTISEVKRALLSSDDLRAIANENTSFIASATPAISVTFDGIKTMPSSAAKAIPLFESLHAEISPLANNATTHSNYGSLAALATQSLEQALQEAESIQKSTPLTKWKNKWLAKNRDNRFIMAGELENKRIEALADVLDQYQAALASAGLYDYDDMITRAIHVLENKKDLKYTLQEQYLYLLLDEFQDTNAAQLKLVELLSDNPVHEGRPNIMAVGDDDQAIYAFQGAQYSNMVDFYNMYEAVKVINLTENYRSHADVLATAHNIAGQIEERLHEHFNGMTKTLVAANNKLPKNAMIYRGDFLSDVAQYDWIAHKIKELTDKKVALSEIAVIAPKHKHLEPLVAHLNELNIPVRYEKRENILEAAIVKQLIAMSRLVLALHAKNEEIADALWPEVLSYDFWQLPTSIIWKLSWQVNDNRKDKATWSKVLLDDEHCKDISLFFLALAHMVNTETCETMLDYLIGSEAVKTNEKNTPFVRSPMREFYTGKNAQKSNPNLFYESISHLRVVRSKLRDYQASNEEALKLGDLLAYVSMYEQANERMINTSPYNQQADAVQLMTVFKAKGLEFEHVFMPSCHDDVWGASSRGNSNKITLPANLAPIRHAGATDDERLRILFVALTRAKTGLYLTGYEQNYNGKATKRLKYLDEQEQEDGSFHANTLPSPYRQVIKDGDEAPALELLELDWRTRHFAAPTITELQGLLESRLKNYALSPTHLNTFTDMEYGGPYTFFFNTMLRFPSAPTTSGQFGNAIHETLEWVQYFVTDNGKAPTIKSTNAYFIERLKLKKLPKSQELLQIERGEMALAAYLSARSNTFKPGDAAEHNFYGEGVFLDNVRLTGKVDKIEIDKENKTITVVDYKTGKSYEKWKKDAKLHKYRQQLYCYKLLIEGSHSYAGYKVIEGRLEFIEPDRDNRINHLSLHFDDSEMTRTKQLIQVVWEHIHALNFPDVTAYDMSLKGIIDFENALLGQ